MPTLFTRIIQREIPANIVFENESVLAFEDIHPQAPHHVLIVPKKEIPTINDLDRETAPLVGELFLAAKEIAKNLGVSESGYRVVMNCNGDAGQTVFHLHLHFLAGRSLHWPPG
ncbi:MAG: histidine triad nucleotide-binding protein [Alphaproteobacteria bacterium]|nr:histidine triad nucleotide-binding protein [Alphaproteobacteria bacterium]NDG84594.1 histidine triad nucleotide-binding protein [Pseudomonadota bacterium]